MSHCRKCNQEIFFQPHPQNPSKLAPFNADGEIHFKTCGKKKKEFASRDEILCPTCEEFPLFVYEQATAAGPRLTVMCDGYHRWHIPFCDANRKLVNSVEDQVKLFMQILEQRWQSRPEFFDAETRPRAAARGRELGDIYSQYYSPVPPEIQKVLQEFEERL